MNACENIDWVPLKISFVEYPKGDLFGKFLAFISITFFFGYCSVGTLILFKRDLYLIVFFIGMLLNEGLNVILKITIADPRPVCHTFDNLFHGYGMPSGHSQSAWFFCIFVICFVQFRIQCSSSTKDRLWKVTVMSVLILWAFLVSYSRVYLQYHTVNQILVGAAAGIGFALLWYLITAHVISVAFPYITSWSISKKLLIRDSSHIKNYLQFEYDIIQRELEKAKSR